MADDEQLDVGAYEPDTDDLTQACSLEVWFP